MSYGLFYGLLLDTYQTLCYSLWLSSRFLDLECKMICITDQRVKRVLLFQAQSSTYPNSIFPLFLKLPVIGYVSTLSCNQFCISLLSFVTPVSLAGSGYIQEALTTLDICLVTMATLVFGVWMLSSTVLQHGVGSLLKWESAIMTSSGVSLAPL